MCLKISVIENLKKLCCWVEVNKVQADTKYTLYIRHENVLEWHREQNPSR